MFLDGGRKLEWTHACTGRTYKLHIERPLLGFEPGTPTPTPPCNPIYHY